MKVDSLLLIVIEILDNCRRRVDKTNQPRYGQTIRKDTVLLHIPGSQNVSAWQVLQET